MSAMRLLATLGLIVLMATADGVISGTVSYHWGRDLGNLADDFVSGTVACWGLWHLTERLS
jgi:hypothetical protein